MVIFHSYVKLPEGRSENGVGESALWEHILTDQMWSRNLQKMHGEVSLMGLHDIPTISQAMFFCCPNFHG